MDATGDLNSATGVFTLDGSMGMDAVFELSALYVAHANVHVAVNPSFHGVATETIMGPGGESVHINGTHVSTSHIAAQQPVSYGTCTPTANAHDPVDNPSFTFSANVDVDVTAGANLDVDILHHTLYDHVRVTLPVLPPSPLLTVLALCRLSTLEPFILTSGILVRGVATLTSESLREKQHNEAPLNF